MNKQWPNKPGFGKYYKRKAARSWRRHNKRLCQIGERAWKHTRGLVFDISNCDWRGT